MGWLKENFADEAPVRGIIVASEISKDLVLATSSVKNIDLVEYEISFKLKSVSGQRPGVPACGEDANRLVRQPMGGRRSSPLEHQCGMPSLRRWRRHLLRCCDHVHIGLVDVRCRRAMASMSRKLANELKNFTWHDGVTGCECWRS